MTDMSQYKVVSIEQLALAPWNYKPDDEVKQKSLVENIRRNGQVENIIVRELSPNLYEVVNGNHRLKAFQELEYKEVMTYNLGAITEAAAVRIAIETNETKFSVDNLKLAQRLEEIAKEFPMDDLLKTLPYNEKEMQEHLKLTSFDWKAMEEAKPPEEPTPEMKSGSDNVVGVQLTFSKEDHHDFMVKAEGLAKKLGKENISDMMLELVRQSHIVHFFDA